MSRRATLPGADELFRRTSDTARHRPSRRDAAGRRRRRTAAADAGRRRRGRHAVAEPAGASPTAVRTAAAAEPVADPGPATVVPPGASGTTRRSPSTSRPEELVDLEQAKLVLRAQHGLAVDRGRIVREAIAVVIADLEAKGEDSILVRRLRGV